MSDTLLIATRKGLFVAERTGAGRWELARTAFLGDRVTLAIADPRDGTWYAALDHGHFGIKFHRSTDRGETWPEVASPAYPNQPEPAFPGEAAEPATEPAEPPGPSVKFVWALTPGGADEPGSLWCGTAPGGLFRSDDRGESWQLCESLWNHPARAEWGPGGAEVPAIHSICVDPRDSRRVVVGVSTGGVWQTRDRGATWEVTCQGMFAEYMPPEKREDPVAQDVHCVVQCAAEPTAFWCQHHNGIFRSTDHGHTWTEVKMSPSSFGFAVAVHPREPDTAWFVPAIKDEHRIPVNGELVMTRTRDGGETNDQLRNGLPQQHAYDLVFRHALDVDESGDRLAFGSSTGSLWITEDQGEDFGILSHHLPPIYAVRFAR